MTTLLKIFICIILYMVLLTHCKEEYCNKDENENPDCNQTVDHLSDKVLIKNKTDEKYTKDPSGRWKKFLSNINDALTNYKPCNASKCSCHNNVIKHDLKVFSKGISKNQIVMAEERGILYQIIDHQLYRSEKCNFPSRCQGIEYFILKIVKDLPDMEFVINVNDWPQNNKHFKKLFPIFSFSKTLEYLDITYPAWTFWTGGPAIKIYPTGLGKWDEMRQIIIKESDKFPWDQKIDKAFFRGSRTSSERDPLIYLSRKNSVLVDASYTTNQGWKSEADTLYAPPAEEVSLEYHCRYKYLFNYRGVAASFRLKHLFLCKSLVFHVGDEWTEFFYQQLKPWVHYIPVSSKATEDQIQEAIYFARENEDVAEEIAMRGYKFIHDHLRIKDVMCYWKKLLKSYAKLMTYVPVKRDDLIRIINQ